MFHFFFFFILINTLQSTKYTVICFGTLVFFFLFFSVYVLCVFVLFCFFPHTVHKSQLFSVRPAKKRSVCTRWESKASTSQLHASRPGHCAGCSPGPLGSSGLESVTVSGPPAPRSPTASPVPAAPPQLRVSPCLGLHQSGS